MNAQRLQTTLLTAALALALAGCAGAAPATPAPAAPAPATAAPTMAPPPTAMPAPAMQTPTQMPAPTAAPMVAAPAATATGDAMMHGGMMMTPTVAGPATAVRPAATAAPKPAGKTVMVDIQVFQFMPNALEVKAGTTVIWTNKDNIEHSITNGVPGKLGGKFDSGFFTQGKTFSFTFTEPGEYPYFCMRHNSMQGMVRVTP
jgi:plastocyanin